MDDHLKNNPLSLDDDSPWRSYYEDIELRDVIDRVSPLANAMLPHCIRHVLNTVAALFALLYALFGCCHITVMEQHVEETDEKAAGVPHNSIPCLPSASLALSFFWVLSSLPLPLADSLSPSLLLSVFLSFYVSPTLSTISPCLTVSLSLFF